MAQAKTIYEQELETVTDEDRMRVDQSLAFVQAAFINLEEGLAVLPDEQRRSVLAIAARHLTATVRRLHFDMLPVIAVWRRDLPEDDDEARLRGMIDTFDELNAFYRTT